MSVEQPASWEERIHALAAFLPQFEQPDFEFGRWESPAKEKPGVLFMSSYSFSKEAGALFEMIYDVGWILPGFDWPSWKDSAEAAELRDNPATLASATPIQLARLLTVVFRQERFVDGVLAEAFESGLLTGIVRRAAQLDADPKGIHT